MRQNSGAVGLPSDIDNEAGLAVGRRRRDLGG
jgi:hypothetical protein